MNNKELREKAEKKVEAKESFYICTIVFSCTTFVLLMLSFYLPAIAIWLTIPIPVFIMVLGVLYISAFGLPFTGPASENWREEEIEKEMYKLSRREKSGPVQSGAPLDPVELELRELEEIKRNDVNDDYV